MMNRLTLLIFFTVLVALFTVACAANAEISVPPAADVAMVEPTATHTPPPTNTPTATPQPTATPTALPPTPVPSPTAVTCNIEVLNEALLAISTLDSYRTHVEAEVRANNKIMQAIYMDMAIVLQAAAMQGADMTMQVVDGQGEENNLRMILSEGAIFMQASPDEPWESVVGEFGQVMLSRIMDMQFLQPQLRERLEEFPCTLSQERLDAQEAQVYFFKNVQIDDLVTSRGMTMADAGLEGVPGDITIWLVEHEGIPLAVKSEMFVDTASTTVLLEVRIVQDVREVNVPMVIEIPEGVEKPAFFLDMPLPEDAIIVLENESVLGFITNHPPGKVANLYFDYFAQNGWEQLESYSQDLQGIPFEVFEYMLGEQKLVVAFGKKDGQTVVSIATEDEP